MECDIGTGTHLDIHLPFQDGWTALMVALHNGHMECVQVLLDRGADVNMQGRVSVVEIICWRHVHLLVCTMFGVLDFFRVISG